MLQIPLLLVPLNLYLEIVIIDSKTCIVEMYNETEHSTSKMCEEKKTSIDVMNLLYSAAE